MSQRKTTLTDLEKLTGVSKSTISRVINNSKHVNPDVRAIVQKAIEATGYKKTSQKFQIDMAITSITLVIGDYLGATSGFYTKLINEIRTVAEQLHLTVDLIVLKAGDNSALQQLKTKQALLLLGLDSPDILASIKSLDLPTVIVNGADLEMGVSSVSPDYELGGLLATNTLIEQGHKKILFIGSSYRHSLFQRKCGFVRALELARIDVNHDKQILILEDYAHTVMGNEELANLIVADHGKMDFGASQVLPHAIESGVFDDITGVFCICDMVAVSLIDSLKKLGKSVPEDISVIGFDDLDISSMTAPPLTTIKTNFAELARSTVHLVIKVSGQQSAVKYRQLTSVEVVPRSSVQRIEAE